MIFLEAETPNIDNEKFNIAEYYFSKVGASHLSSTTCGEFLTGLLIIMIIRFLLLFTSEKKLLKKSKSKLNIGYLIGKCFIEFLLALVISFLIIVFTGSDPYNGIFNTLIAPSVGFLISIYINNKYIMPLQSKENKEKEIKDEPNENKEVTEETENEKGLLNESVTESDDFNEIVVGELNKIIVDQCNQKCRMDEYCDKLENCNNKIDKLMNSEMINKKIELKKLMYSCLNKGYATPEENDKITMLYQSYTNDLGGNGEVKSLYELHYVKLEVHEDRRRYHHPVIVEDKNEFGETELSMQSPIIEYGKFDKECLNVDYTVE